MKTKPKIEMASHGAWWRGRVTFTRGLHRIGFGQHLLSLMAGVTLGPGRSVECSFLFWSVDYCRLIRLDPFPLSEPPAEFTGVMEQFLKNILGRR